MLRRRLESYLRDLNYTPASVSSYREIVRVTNITFQLASRRLSLIEDLYHVFAFVFETSFAYDLHLPGQISNHLNLL